MFRRLCVWILILAPLPTFAAASKEIQELQRDIAQLQDMVKALQRAQDSMKTSQDEKFTELRVLVQQAITAANNADKALAVIQSSQQQSVKDQESKILPPVVQLSSRMDSMSGDLRNVQQAVSDLAGLLSKVQTQLTDISTTVKVLSAPPAAPPAPAAGAAPETPPLSATDLLDNANRDRMANNLDLALQGYANYLKYYGDSPQAADAQFYIAYIHFLQKDYENALAMFDTVVEKYPKNNIRAPQALVQKGTILLSLPNRKTEAAQAFRDVVTQYPKSTYVDSACEKLVGLGYNCPAGRGAQAPAKSPAKSTSKK